MNLMVVAFGEIALMKQHPENVQLPPSATVTLINETHQNIYI